MIRILDKYLADKIAAGEVIDRPVSIVKELVENSLDSGADSISVEIRGGGREYIRVTDNGCGIAADEIETAFLRHATSKISSEEDLDAIDTLGFRGEALASICAVSRVEMISRSEDDSPGRSLIVEGGKVIENRGTGCPIGTTVRVRDLFYNVPARLKFLSSDSAESRRIIDTLSRIALAYPDVRFALTNGGKDVFNTSGRGNILDNILRIYGRDLERSLLPVDHQRTQEGFVLRGFVSEPSTSTTTRSRQYFCINGRVVSSKTVERGLEKGYRERLFAGRHPIAFLFLSVPAETIDVNVHPTKKEIRFKDPFKVEDMVEEAVRNALNSSDAVPAASIKAPGKPLISENIAPKKDEEVGGSSDGDQIDVKSILETMRSELSEAGNVDFAASSDEEVIRDDDSASSSMKRSGGQLEIMSMNVVGIVLDTYIIGTIGDTMYMIDQHAAHERVLYERLLSAYHSRENPSQSLLVPLQLTVSAETASVEDEWTPALRRMGYDIEAFGERVYIVREIPAFLSYEGGETFIREFLMGLEDKPDIRDFADLDRIITRSCRSAVKSGDALHDAEVATLLEQLSICDNPYSCPHGRPVFIKMSLKDLDRMFKRGN